MMVVNKLDSFRQHIKDTNPELADIWYLFVDDPIASTSDSSDEASFGTFSGSLADDLQEATDDSSLLFSIDDSEMPLGSSCKEIIEDIYPNAYDLHGVKEMAVDSVQDQDSDDSDDQLQHLDQSLNLAGLDNLDSFDGGISHRDASCEPARVEQMVAERSDELPDHFVVLQYNGKRGPTTATDVWRDCARGVRSLAYRERDIPSKKKDLCDALKRLPKETRISVNLNDVEFVVPIKFQECVHLLQQNGMNKVYKRLDSKSKTRYYKVAEASIILKDLWGRQKKSRSDLKESPCNTKSSLTQPVAVEFFTKEEAELNNWIGHDAARAKASRSYKQQLELQRAILSGADNLDAATRSELEVLCKATLDKSWEVVHMLHTKASRDLEAQQRLSSFTKHRMTTLDDDVNSIPGQHNSDIDLEIGDRPEVRHRKRRKFSRNLAMGAVVLSFCAVLSVFTTRKGSPTLVGEFRQPMGYSSRRLQSYSLPAADSDIYQPSTQPAILPSIGEPTPNPTSCSSSTPLAITSDDTTLKPSEAPAVKGAPNTMTSPRKRKSSTSALEYPQKKLANMEQGVPRPTAAPSSSLSLSEPTEERSTANNPNGKCQLTQGPRNCEGIGSVWSPL